MIYLGRRYSFMSESGITKKILTDSTLEALTFVGSLPISPEQKCHTLNLPLGAHMSFPFSHYTISQTWIKANLNGLVTNKVRLWLDLPPNATAHFMPLPPKWLGLDLVLPSMLSKICQLGTALTIHHSKDSKMGGLGLLVNGRVPLRDLLSAAMRTKASKSAKKLQLDRQLQSLHGLRVQPSSTNHSQQHFFLLTSAAAHLTSVL